MAAAITKSMEVEVPKAAYTAHYHINKMIKYQVQTMKDP